jgi:uncharacterized protein
MRVQSPRGELAAHILQAFTVVDMIAIFAPRRKGKTWFVLRDLSPASIKKDYVPVYASLWRTPDKPHLAIIEALKLVQEARKRKRRVLLLIDEAQHLATSSAFDSTTKSLRTAIEGLRATQPGSIKALFTGSSRTDLVALLEDKNAAFYQGFDRQELPDLERSYTDFVADQLARLGKVLVGRDGLRDTFCELQKSPYFMQELIRELMLKRAKTLKEARQGGRQERGDERPGTERDQATHQERLYRRNPAARRIPDRGLGAQDMACDQALTGRFTRSQGA